VVILKSQKQKTLHQPAKSKFLAKKKDRVKSPYLVVLSETVVAELGYCRFQVYTATICGFVVVEQQICTTCIPRGK
jgi:hypothetical protein